MENGDMETCRHVDIKRKTENGSPGDFPFVYHLFIVQTEVCLFFVSWRNKLKLSVDKRTKQTNRLSHLYKSNHLRELAEEPGGGMTRQPGVVAGQAGHQAEPISDHTSELGSTMVVKSKLH